MRNRGAGRLSLGIMIGVTAAFVPALARADANAQPTLHSYYSVQVQCTYLGTSSAGDRVSCGGTTYTVDLGQLPADDVTALNGSAIPGRAKISGDILINAARIPFRDESGAKSASPCQWYPDPPNLTFALSYYVSVAKKTYCGRPDGTNTWNYSGLPGACAGVTSCDDNNPSRTTYYTIACAPSVNAEDPNQIRCPPADECMRDKSLKITKPAGTQGVVEVQAKSGGDGICFDGKDARAIDAPGGKCPTNRADWDQDRCITPGFALVGPYSSTKVDTADSQAHGGAAK